MDEFCIALSLGEFSLGSKHYRLAEFYGKEFRIALLLDRSLRESKHYRVDEVCVNQANFCQTIMRCKLRPRDNALNHAKFARQTSFTQKCDAKITRQGRSPRAGSRRLRGDLEGEFVAAHVKVCLAFDLLSAYRAFFF
ncbi:MAG: hypothetical protein LBK41_05115 [Clostridiales bacterium]|nr:hypothetical protein [Clostridiales bacterium]